MAENDEKQSEHPIEKQKRRFRIGPLRFLFFLIGGYLLLILTPLSGLIIAIIPNTVINSLLADWYQHITLDETGSEITADLDLEHDSPLPVLGIETGLCFFFHSTIDNEIREEISAERLEKARQTQPIAKITAHYGTKQYELKNTRLELGTDQSNKDITIVCQEFGVRYSALPEHISFVSVHTDEPFKPYKIAWVTQANLDTIVTSANKDIAFK